MDFYTEKGGKGIISRQYPSIGWHGCHIQQCNNISLEQTHFLMSNYAQNIHFEALKVIHLNFTQHCLGIPIN